MQKQFEKIRDTETASIYSDFNFAQTMRENSMAEHWKEKRALWTLISGACNDAGKEFYIKLREFVENIADIDMCTSKALKSMAESVNVSYLTDFIKTDYPPQLQRLIDIFSISKSNLLRQYNKLNENAIAHKYGMVNIRNKEIYPEEKGFHASLMYDILDNLDELRYVLETLNGIDFNLSYWNNINTNSIDTSTKYYFHSDGKYYTNPSLNKIFEELEYYKSLINVTDSTNKNNASGIYGGVSYQENINGKFLGEYVHEDVTKYYMLDKCTKIMRVGSFVPDGTTIPSNKIVLAYNILPDVVLKNPSYYNHVATLYYDQVRVLRKSLSNFDSATYSTDIKYYITGETGILPDGVNSSSLVQIYRKSSNGSILEAEYVFSQLPEEYNFINGENYDIYTIDNPKSSSMNITVDDRIINPFMALIAVFKHKIIDLNNNTALRLRYTDPLTNMDVDVSSLVYRIVETIQSDSKSFHEYYLTFHFYGLFYDMIVNDYLKNQWSFSDIENVINTTFTGVISEMTEEELWNEVNHYISYSEFEEFINTGINRFQRYHVDFIEYLSLLNNFLICENTETINNNLVNSSNSRLPYVITKYNNDLPIDNNYNAEFRKMLNLDEYGKPLGISPLVKLARSFADYCIQISIARENVKSAIQQYARIGTNKIIEDATTEFFLKQLSNRNDWGLYSEKSVASENSTLYESYGMFNDVKTLSLDSSSDYFRVDLIEYYDTTNYLNIQADLPNFINGYTEGKQLSTYIDSTSTVQLSSVMVTWRLDEDTISGSEPLDFSVVEGEYVEPISAMNFTYTTVISTSSEILSGYLETNINTKSINTNLSSNNIVYNDLTSSSVDMLTSDEREYFNQNYLDSNLSASFNTPKYFSPLSTNVVSSNLASIVDTDRISGLISGQYQYLIPSGTLVYKVVPSTVTVTLQTLSTYFEQIPNVVPCSNFVTEYNSRFWERNSSTVSEEKLLDEIEFWTPFFEVLQNTNTTNNKKKVFNNEVYPFLCKIWNMYATSGFLDNSELSGMHLKYSGKAPGLYLTENIGNSEFPTIAPVQNLENLVTENQIYSDSLLYLIKPYYEEMVYYINLVARQILDMHKINQETGLGTPSDGWEQIRNEYYGYNSIYEQAKHTTNTNQTPSKIIDVDGPWVYSTLQQFIKLYYDNEIQPGYYQIPYSKIKEFVNTYYTDIHNIQIETNFINRIFVFQHEIIKRQYYRVYDFQTDDKENNFILYKHTNFDKYEDCGEIWIRLKNHGLALPAMHYTIIENQLNVYENDPNDVIQCNEQITYTNALKQLFNNAIQFGIVGNTIWILGRSNYINYGQGLEYVPSQLYLKLCFIQFNYSLIEGLFKFDLSTCKFFSLSNNYDFLNDINEFVGVYYNRYNKVFQILLYDKTNFINNITTYNESSESLMDLTNLSIPITLMTYNISEPAHTESTVQTFSNAALPIAGLFAEKQITNSKCYAFYDPYINTESTKDNAPVTYSTSGLLEQFIGYAVELSGNTQSVTGWIEMNPSTNIIGIYFDALSIPQSASVTSLVESDLSARLLSSNAFPTSVKMTEDYTFMNPNISGIVSGFNDILSGKWILNEFKTIPNDFKILYNNEYLNKGIRIIDIHKSELASLDESLSAYADTLTSGYMINYTNVWRINSDLSRVNIAYESINFDEYLGNNHFYDKLLESTKSFYVDVIQFTFDISVIKQSSVYMTIFKNYDYKKLKDKISIPIQSRKMLANSAADLTAIHESYPYCNITSDNKLIVKTIVTQLGGEKSVDIDTQSAKDMLMATISDNYSSRHDTNITETDVVPYMNILSFITNDFQIDNESDKNLINEKVQSIIDELIFENDCIDPREYADSIITSTNNFEIIRLSTSLENGEFFGNLYNEITKESLDSLGMLAQTSRWIPCTTDCLVEPLKIVCNFGDLPDSVKEFITGTESFDLDISVYIDDSDFENTEVNKPVGWHCGYKKTDYVEWITDDVTINGPEIVLVDLQKYKNHILSKFKNDTIAANEYLKNVKIDIHVCWYSESMLISSSPRVDVAWKGFYNEYKFTTNQMTTNSKCCKNNNKITLNVDLTNSATYFGQAISKVCPVINILEEVGNDTLSASIGYYNLLESDINSLKVRMQDGIAGNSVTYFNNFDGYCNSVEINEEKNKIYTSWFLYDIGGILNNRTYSNINEIAIATKSLINDNFKLEISKNSYINPFDDTNKQVSYEYEVTPFSILHDRDKLDMLQSKMYEISKNRVIPAELNFITSGGIYSDTLNTIFSAPFMQEYSIGQLNNSLQIINENIDTNIIISGFVTKNNIDFSDINNKYFIEYLCKDDNSNEILDTMTYDEANIFNSYTYKIDLKNLYLKSVDVNAKLYYRRKYNDIELNTATGQYVFVGNPFINDLPTEIESVLGMSIQYDVNEKLQPEFVNNDNIGISAVIHNNSGLDFTYNIGEKTIEGTSNQNINATVSFDISVYLKNYENYVISTFVNYCTINNKELSGEIYIDNNDINSIVFIRQPNQTETLEYAGYINSDTLENYDLLSGFELNVVTNE